MESGFIAIISEIIKQGAVSEYALLCTIIFLMLAGYKYCLKPIYERIKKLPSTKELKEIIIESEKSEQNQIVALSEKLDGLIKSIEENMDVDRGSYREVKDLSRDLEHVKQILNQIQGHFMYKGSGSFGNQELR